MSPSDDMPRRASSVGKHQLFWIVFGAAYGLMLRFVIPTLPKFVGAEVVSIALLFCTPFAIGAIVVYGLRHTKPTVGKMILAPWLAILLSLIGSMVGLLEGSICVILASPFFFIMSSVGGLVMGLIVRGTSRETTALHSFMALPLAMILVEPSIPHVPQILEDRISVEIAASPNRIWTEILNARDIRIEELTTSFTHMIGVPRPIEGANVMTPEGEVRHSRWERGVSFSAIVTQRDPDRLITWQYRFTADSFPPGSMDDHVRIGGQYFDLYDTSFVLEPLSRNRTRLEIVSHYRVTTNFNAFAVPIARFIAKDFMSAIVHLYKIRSERAL
jgi:hypothetical protein